MERFDSIVVPRGGETQNGVVGPPMDLYLFLASLPRQSSSANQTEPQSAPKTPDKAMDQPSPVLRECLFSLQGISGESYIKFYEIGNEIRVRVGPNAKKSDQDALYLCGEAGCIYQVIQRTVCEYERHRSSISHAFAMAVTNELHQYTTFLRTLHPRSLRHIVAETAPAIRSLKHLARITDTCLTGPDLLSWLHLLEQTHVQTSFRAILGRIQQATRRPWYDSLNSWVVQGTLDDSDFFVSAVSHIPTREIWRSGHALDRTKVPDGLLLTDREVELSYLVGKGVHYIRKVLCDMKWESPSFDADSNSSLQEASKKVHSHILSTLRTEHHLLEHLHALKQFFLLGQGDFCATLLDGLHSTEGTIYKHTLGVLVDTALHGAVGLSDEFCERLQVEVRDHVGTDHITNFAMGPTSLPPSAGSVWDVLTLTYTVPDPIVAIVHPAAMQTYQSLFRTLWTIRQVEHHLSVMWQQNSVLQRALQVNAQHLQVTVHTNTNYAQAIALLRQVSMVRQSVMHFVMNLQSYLQMDVLEAAWKHLLDRVEGAETLDDIIAAHDAYLHVMARQSFCVGDDQGMDRKIKGLLGIAKRFCSYQEAVFCDALESVDRAAERRRQAEWLTDQGAWGFEQKDEEEESCFGLSDPALLEELGGLVQVFHREMNLLLGQLDEKLYGSSKSDRPIAGDSPNHVGVEALEQLDEQDDLDALRSLAGQLGNNGFYVVEAL